MSPDEPARPTEVDGGAARGAQVLHVVPSLDEAMGGSVHAALRLCEARLARGEPTRVVATVGPGDRLDYLDTDFATVWWDAFRRRPPHGRFWSPSLGRWLARRVASFDLVHVHGIFPVSSLAAARWCRRRRVPYVVQPHGSLDPFDLRRHAPAKAAFAPVGRRALAGAGAVVCTTALEAERLVTWGAEVERVVVPLPVPAPPVADGAEFRRRHGLAVDAVVVLFIGRLHEKKGIDLLVPAVQALRAREPRLHLMVVGEGAAAYEAEVDALLAAPRAEGWATRLGFLSGEDKGGAYAAADVFALPSRNENFGITVVEAAAAGEALLVSEETYVCDAVDAAGAGVVCPPTAEGCEAGLARLVDAGRRAAAGAAARRMAAERFSPEAAGAAMDAAYARVLAGGRLG